VTLVERDALDDAPAVRKGAPQGRHVHALLSRGLESIERLFPGFTEAIAADGANRVPMGDLQVFFFGTFRRRFDIGLDMYFQSRPLVESHLRRRVRALPNVRVRDGVDVSGLVSTGGGRRAVTGVRIVERANGGAGSKGAELLPAELVVDASGRGSRTPAWLEEMGLERPRESQVRIDLGYATRIYEPPGSGSTGEAFRPLVVVGQAPESGRFGVVFPIEGGRWLVSLGGMHGDHPPTDEEGFAAFARSLPVPHVHDALSSARPHGDIVPYRFLSSMRRHYEALRRFPDRLVVLGDAACSLNPAYGQGMTVAALEAELLDACLGAGREALGPTFHRRAAKIVDGPWLMGTTEAFRFPETAGSRPVWLPLVHRYMERVNAVAARDRDVAIRMFRTMQMLDPPTAVFHPAVLLRVARTWSKDA